MTNKVKKIGSILIVCCILIIISFSNVFASSIVEKVSYWFDPKIIRIKNDDTLKEYLALNSNNSKKLAEVTKGEYYLEVGDEIKISDDSLAVEIVGHVYPEKIAKYLPRFIRNKIIKHTEIIDCGEKDVDSNRWIWDSIASVLNYTNRRTISDTNLYDTNKNLRMMTSQCNVVSYDKDKIIDEIIQQEKKLRPNIQLDREIMKLVLIDIEKGDLDYTLKSLVQ